MITAFMKTISSADMVLTLTNVSTSHDIALSLLNNYCSFLILIRASCIKTSFQNAKSKVLIRITRSILTYSWNYWIFLFHIN